jgi:serine kinase of HPr protein (carbohydrate metabolism regulator)
MVHGFGKSAFGWTVAVLTDCEDVREVLDRYVMPWLPGTKADPEGADTVFFVGRSAESPGFKLQAGDLALASSPTLEALIPDLQNWMDYAILRKLTDKVAIHAGAVAYGGSAIVLPGPSRAGKSTLVAELLRRGFVYFSDEYALIDGKGHVHPYPRPLMLRKGGEPQPVLASEWNAAIGRESAPVRLVVTLEHLPDREWSVRRVGQSEMLVTLLKNTPHILAERCNMLAALLRASANAACYVGVRNEAGDAADRILDLLAGDK